MAGESQPITAIVSTDTRAVASISLLVTLHSTSASRRQLSDDGSFCGSSYLTALKHLPWQFDSLRRQAVEEWGLMYRILGMSQVRRYAILAEMPGGSLINQKRTAADP